VSDIRTTIVRRRRERIEREGHALRATVPETRLVPIVPLLQDPPVICEIKRRSPSRGAIASKLDPVEQAGRYVERGVRSISILTEEDHFAGSLNDLVAVKRAYPELSVLRKDFLLDDEDVELSYRAGADAVLLIASILSADELARLNRTAAELGMAALVEVHDNEDIAKARDLKPELVGINARDLTTFTVDLLTPMRIRHLIDWPNRTVFESGVFTREHARLVASGGFAGLLVGEAVVRRSDCIPEIIDGFRLPRRDVSAFHPTGDFWSRLAAGSSDSMGSVTAGGPSGGPSTGGPVRRPLVKICGITNREDAESAISLGADLIGFVMADSPRRATPEFVRSMKEIDVLKVAVVVSGGSHGPLDPDVAELLREGAVDAIQFHGEESPDECETGAFPYYRAVRLGSTDDAQQISAYGSPRVLVDARARDAYGGTGKRLSQELVAAAAARGPLWIAGGINDENIAEVIRSFRPELVDASSGLEREPGRKDHARIRRFFAEVQRETIHD